MQPQRWQKCPSLLGRHHRLWACAVLPGPWSAPDGVTTPVITVSFLDGCELGDHPLPRRELTQQTWAFPKGRVVFLPILQCPNIADHESLVAFALFRCLCLNEKVGGCSPGSSAALLHPVAAAHGNWRGFCLLRRDCGVEVGHSHDSTWERAPERVLWLSWNHPKQDATGCGQAGEASAPVRSCWSRWDWMGTKNRAFSSYLVMLFLV